MFSVPETDKWKTLSKTDPKQLYDELTDRINEFHSIKILPIPLNIVKLEDGLDLGQKSQKLPTEVCLSKIGKST